MSRKEAERCAACSMKLALCVCAFRPTLHTRTRVVLLLHATEAHKTTNTGRLAVGCLPNSRTVEVADGARTSPVVEGEPDALLLFPGADARPLREVAQEPRRPVTLMVPDGTWRQARKMRTRVPGLALLPCVTLPDAPATAYRLRVEGREGGLSTLEAIAWALELLEGPAVGEALRAFQRVFVERTLWSRGALAADDVTGGIPPDAR